MKIVFFVVASFFSFSLVAQSYAERFNDLFDSDDIDGQRQLLSEWEKNSPHDSELYTSYFNFYFSLGQEEFITIESLPRNDMSIEIFDTLTNSKSYLESKYMYNENELKKALDYIDKGIAKFDKRLDMRFGKIYALGEIKRWDLFTNEIIATIMHSALIDNKWDWTNNSPMEDGANYLLATVQDYINQLFSVQSDSLLASIRLISETVLENYPRHKESYLNIGISYIAQKKYDEALSALALAEQIDANDIIVLSNTAFCHKQLKNKEKAIGYYLKTKEYGSEEVKMFADRAIKELEHK